MSLQAIATEVNRHPSTVALWLRNHGLQAVNHSHCSPKGGLDKDELAQLVGEGLTLEQLAARLDRSLSTVCYWMRRHGLKTRRAERRATPVDERPRTVERVCARHGLTTYQHTGAKRHYRCLLCRAERVARRRRQIKETLVHEAGGRCRLCGYDRWMGALQFHHVDPAEKEFNIALRGVARSLDRARREAEKCVLLCANCHAEVEGGFVGLAIDSGARTPPINQK
jgi:hypothetical protein